MTNPDSILKSRDITLPTKEHLIKATVFPVVMYGCESWSIKKAEYRRIDVFGLWCWRRLLSVTWTARRSNLFILRRPVLGVHWKDWCWGWNSDTLATSCKELTHWKRPWCWDGLRAGGEGDDGEWNGWMASPTQWMWVWASFRRWWRAGKTGVLQSLRLQWVRHYWVAEQEQQPHFYEGILSMSYPLHFYMNFKISLFLQDYVICEKWYLHFFLSTVNTFIYFVCLSVLIRTSIPMLTRSRKSVHLCLVPNIRRKTF